MSTAGRVDSGASYFTAADPAFVEQAEDWCARGLARPWTDRFPSLTSAGLGEAKPGPWRYATSRGLRSLVADLAAGPPALSLVKRSPVSQVEPGPSVDGERADAVVLAMPDPQVRRLIDDRLGDVLAQVTGRQWEPALALLAFYPRRSWPDFDGAFINSDPILRWVADDGSRRGDSAPVLVAHSTPSFAAAHLAASQDAVPTMVDALARLLDCGQARPQLTSTAGRSARPADSREEPYYFGSDRIGLAGDGWGSPRVEDRLAFRSRPRPSHRQGARLMAGNHPIFAPLYNGLAWFGERTTLGRWREEALAAASGRLLVVGLGPGYDLAHLPPAVTEVVAVEPAAAMRRIAQRRVLDGRPPIELVEGIGEQLPLADASVDSALCALVLCTVTDPVAVVREIARVLKPGGVLCVLEHVRAPDGSRLGRVQDRSAPAWSQIAGGCRPASPHARRDRRRWVRCGGPGRPHPGPHRAPAGPDPYRYGPTAASGYLSRRDKRRSASGLPPV